MRTEVPAVEAFEAALLRENAVKVFSVRRLLPSLLASFGIAGALFLVILPVINGDPIYQAANAHQFWIRLIGVFIVGSAPHLVRFRQRAGVQRNARAAAEKMRREYVDMTNDRWLLNTVKMGARLASMIWIPIGLLIFIFSAQDEPAVAERMRTVFYFGAATFGWAIPMAFLIRWLSLKSLGRFLASS